MFLVTQGFQPEPAFADVAQCRASPCQGEGREFESLHPLLFLIISFSRFLLELSLLKY